jgi:hypothetical protein
MLGVQSIRYGCQWSGGAVIASPLRVELGERGAETTVDAMLRGEGWTMMEPEQLAHLVAGLVRAPSVVQVVGFKNAPFPGSVTLRSTLQLFGYTVESC